MIADWLIVALVIVSLWAFWLWLGALFDAISDLQAAWRAEREREALPPLRERGD
jgi:hypothetical protein